MQYFYTLQLVHQGILGGIFSFKAGSDALLVVSHPQAEWDMKLFRIILFEGSGTYPGTAHRHQQG